MNQKVYVGIDLAKDSSRVAVVDKDGNKLTSPFSVKNTREGMEKLLSKLNSYKNDQILCGMEASSNYFRKRLLIPEREKSILSTYQSISGKKVQTGSRSKD